MTKPPLAISRLALALAAFLSGLYLLTASGHTYSIDEELMFGVTESLVLHRSFALNAGTDADTPHYSEYGPGQSIAAIPFYLLAQPVASWFGEGATPWVLRAIVGWLNILVTATTAVLIFIGGTTLGYRCRAALGAALLYGLATMAWPHSKTFFAEPLTALLTFASAILILLASTREHIRQQAWLLVSAGLVAGLALPVKIQGGLALPLLAIYAAVCCHPRIWYIDRMTFVRLLFWGSGAMLALGLLALYQSSLFGGVEKSGYGNILEVLRHAIISYPLQRFYTLLISPGRGILWFAPPVLLFPWGIWYLWCRNWQISALCASMVALNIFFYSFVKYFGDGAWGPRFLNIPLPFMLFPLVGYLDGIRGWQTPWRTSGLFLTVLIAIPVQIAALLINPALYIMESDRQQRYYDPAQSPITGHLTIAAQQVSDYWDIHHRPDQAGLLHGFSYSEGQRSQNEQFPRWTFDDATIGIRPPAAQQVSVSLLLVGCRPDETLPPAEVTVSVHGTSLFHDSPCPPRYYHLLLPPTATILRIESTTWEPASVGIDRHTPLGVLIQESTIRVDGKPLPIVGALVPIEPLPPYAGPVTIRKWTVDHRYGHWDFWWWYLAHAGFPTWPSRILAIGWLGLALGLIGWGGWNLRHRRL